MFGYVLINKPEMKFREYDVYHSYYCGLCKAIKRRHGFFSRFCINYDFTFLALLLSSLYEPPNKALRQNCCAHPFGKMDVRTDACIDYCSDMNVFLSYLKCLDDWQDERKAGRGFYALLLKKRVKKIKARYPEKTKAVMDCMEKLANYEQADCMDLDSASGAFGELMKQLFTVREDAWTESLQKMGFFLGKFIYLMDAYEDLVKDSKSGNYNILLHFRKRDDFESFVKNALLSMMAECCRAFEYLPIVENIEILRNILYSGIWYKYNLAVDKRKKESGK